MRLSRSPATIFMFSSVIFIPLALIIFCLSVKGFSPWIDGEEYSYAYSGKGSKSDYISTLTAEAYRDAVGQMYYISELIDSNDKERDLKLARLIVSESLQGGYDPFLVTAVILAESTFNHRAKSNKGALGLMQLLPDTAMYISKVGGIDWKGRAHLLEDPAYNIRLGIAYLKHLEGYFGQNRKNILIAYNWGPANLLGAQKNRSNIPSMSIKYAEKILASFRNWSSEYESRRDATKYTDPKILQG